MGIKPPGFANVLRRPGDTFSINDVGELVAVPGGAGGLWDALVTYGAGAIVSGSDDNVYVSLAAGNVGHNPTTDGGVHWTQAVSAASFGTVWAGGTTYPAGAIVSGSDDNVYVSLGAGNVGHDPTTDAGVHWRLARGTVVTAEAADFTAISGHFHTVDASGGAVAATVSHLAGTRVVIKKVDASGNAVTVALDAGTIDGAATYVLTVQYQSVTVVTDGTNGWVE